MKNYVLHAMVYGAPSFLYVPCICIQLWFSMYLPIARISSYLIRVQNIMYVQFSTVQAQRDTKGRHSEYHNHVKSTNTQCGWKDNIKCLAILILGQHFRIKGEEPEINYKSCIIQKIEYCNKYNCTGPGEVAMHSQKTRGTKRQTNTRIRQP